MDCILRGGAVAERGCDLDAVHGCRLVAAAAGDAFAVDVVHASNEVDAKSACG